MSLRAAANPGVIALDGTLKTTKEEASGVSDLLLDEVSKLHESKHDIILPSGLTQAEYDAQTRAPLIFAGNITPFLVATIFVIARFWSRQILKGSWAQDDIWVFISWMGALAHTALNCSITFYGIGRHVSVQVMENAVRVLVISYGTRILYQCILATTKIAILTLYLRIFTDAKSKVIVYGMITFVVLYTIPCLLLLIFECTPLYDSWNPLRFPRTCVNLTIQVFMSAGFNILLDLLMIAFAVPRVLPLKLPRLQKAGLIAITSLSSLVVISSVVRLIRISALRKSTDLPWDSYDFTTWSAIEINVGLFCATAPAIRPAIRAMKGALRMNSSPTMSHNARFPTSIAEGVELEDGEVTRPIPALPAKGRFWSTKRGRVTKRELSDADSSKDVMNDVSMDRSPESGRTRSGTESDGEMGERRAKHGGGTLFV
ncbi:hypothetical protein VE03_06448 [Pseudogymnoascus sp. 23342-1-I1]|nr:hypothetical protein VE03_06448 [Pseudogymnoascus sp. 23342-1-I1]